MKQRRIPEGTQVSEANAPLVQELRDAIEELKDGEVELTGILFIKMSDLLKRPPAGDRKEGVNPIPQSVRAGLFPIVKEEA